ncbi:hypothetical protein ACH5RR_029244 [Cinchona calisaya]|uniref:Uncharacterized protein n=1 Tax=Cinchona calisaya TaxID=153742 RepID=A0ABD2YSA8_9GENT
MQKFSRVTEVMQTQADNLNTQFESIGYGGGGSTLIACTRCGIRVPYASTAHQHDPTLNKNPHCIEQYQSSMEELSCG